MAGLLDFLGQSNPQQQGLLSAAAAILNASGPSPTPRSFGQVLSQGLLGYQQAQEQQMQRQMREMQMQNLSADLEDQQLKRQQQRDIEAAARATFKTPEQMAASLPGGPTIANAARIPDMKGGFDTEDFINRVMAINPIMGMQMAQSLRKAGPEFDTKPQTGVDANGQSFQYIIAKNGTFKRLDGVLPRDKLENVNGVWQNPWAQQNGSVAPQDPNKPFSIGADGRPVANLPYQHYEINKSRAGASNVSVNTATKPFLSEIGKGAGEAVNVAYQGALAASKTLQNVDQIRHGLGSAIIGPGANARVTLAQLGQTLGVTGKDTAEQLANTRMVMQGLARQELSAAEQMKGQGQITESERGILRRAESGMIGDFTAPEINSLLNALEKTARYRISQHQANMQRLEQDPNARGIVDYMRIDTPAQPANNGNVRRYNPVTGRIE